MRYFGSRLGPPREECSLLGTKCAYAVVGTCTWLLGNLHVSGVTTAAFACLALSLLFSVECRILSIFRTESSVSMYGGAINPVQDWSKCTYIFG